MGGRIRHRWQTVVVHRFWFRGERNTDLFAIKPRGDEVGFLYHDRGVKKDLVTVDGAGKIVDTVTLAEENGVSVWDWLEVDDEVLVAGSDDGDAWLGRLEPGGALDTLATFEYLGFDDDGLGNLRRHGEIIGALAVVEVADHDDWDLDNPDVFSTLLLEYDEHGIEQRRTVFSGGDDYVSVVGSHLDVTADGTWIVAGTKQYDLFHSAGWAKAVRAGEVVWTFESSGAINEGFDWPSASLYAGVAAQDVLLVGNVFTWAGVRPWLVRLDGATGGLQAEFVGPPSPGAPSSYTGAGMVVDGRVWLVGYTSGEESVVQWLCSTTL